MREFYSLSLTICYCLIQAEDEPDQKIIERLEYIEENTHESILLPLTTTELIILTNLGRGLSNSIEFRDNEGRVREYSLHTLIRYAKKSYFELAKFVVKIGKKYSLDIPMRTQQDVFEIPTAPDLIAMESGDTGQVNVAPANINPEMVQETVPLPPSLPMIPTPEDSKVKKEEKAKGNRDK